MNNIYVCSSHGSDSKFRNEQKTWKYTKKANVEAGVRNQIKVLRQDLSRIEQMKKGMEWTYRLQERSLKYASEHLKERIRAKATKIKRYEERNKQSRQNRLFESDQGKFFDEY